MTFRDPYTGVERAPPSPRSLAARWWPALVIAAIAIAAGVAEWRDAAKPYSPHPAAVAAASNAAPEAAAKAPTPSPPVPSDELAAATAALTRASDLLAHDSELLIGVGALQVIVLAGQLYLFGRQRRATPRKPEQD